MSSPEIKTEESAPPEPSSSPQSEEPSVPEEKPKQEKAFVVTSSPDFEPASIVLAKVKGYPPWPAMVLEESILPANLISKKPKPPRNAVGAVHIIPVRFFSDDTYIWMKINDIKKLEPEEITSFLEKGEKKRKKDLLLKQAYELAQSPPDMHLFNLYGSKGKPEEVPDDEGMDVIELEDEEDEEEDEEIEEDEEEDVKPAKKKRKTPTKTTKPKSKKATPKAKKIPEPEQDSDWGLDEGQDYDYETGDYIFDEEKEQIEFNQKFPRASEINETLSSFSTKFNKISDVLVNQLLAEQIEESETLTSLTKLKDLLAKMPMVIFTKSYLYKVFVLSLHKPIDTFGSEKVRLQIEKILSDALKLEIPALTSDEVDRMLESDASNQKDATPTVENVASGEVSDPIQV